jgi:Holliday junction resolvase
MKKSKVSARDYLLRGQNEMIDLTKYLNGVIKDNPKVGWHYKEFGKQVEQPIIEFLVKKGFLVKNKFIDQSDNKNEIPDIIDEQYSQLIFIDIKAGNKVVFKTGANVNNPNQDLSTTTNWRDKVFHKFDPELCFFIEVKYNHLVGKKLFVEECQFDHFYNFVGKTADGLIAHRRRNVRTKSWNTDSQFKNAEEFKMLLNKTISFSVKNTLFNSSQDLNEEDKIEIINHLRKK